MLEKAYAPAEVERKWIGAWKAAGLFRAEPSGDPRNSYTIVIPPPNVTGALHIGHALNNTLQDVLIRYQRLMGRTACWVPGTDHGGIATQNVMEKQLKAERLTRLDLGREKFLERMRAWTLDCKKTILGQLERLGCALDLSREAFTMDEKRAAAVFSAFLRLWREGRIYRGERMVNWCVRCSTALSDIEVEYEERKGALWHIRYPVKGKPGVFLTVATTRPETMLGDTAVAVNPADPRYKSLVGRKVELPLAGRDIPVVADPHVDSSFGTGALKVTPGHDPNDFEIWQRHKEEIEGPLTVIDLHGRMAPAAGAAFAGLPREDARRRVVERLKEEGLLEKEEEHRHSVGVCYRCQQVIEPLLSEQWFLEIGTLARKASEALEGERLRIHPDSWEGPYRAWLENIRDWCLSRQIWWGHRIPVWYCGQCHGDKIKVFWPEKGAGKEVLGELTTVRHLLQDDGIPVADIEALAKHITVSGMKVVGGERVKGLVVSASRPGPCPDCGKADWLQDPDVLDTWFSSALWPLSVFGWPEETRDLAFFYPTKVLVTGYEILYLWVARMQMLGLQFMDEPPFAEALIHGIVRDKAGKKMSKSLGNVIDPLVMMDEHGTDAFRFSLALQAHPGRDIPYAEDSIRGPRNFANKLWNASRFVLMNLPEEAPAGGYCLDEIAKGGLQLADRWILSEFQGMLSKVHDHMAAYRLAAAADAVYAFLWDKFCDWYVELSKFALNGDDPSRKAVTRAVLAQVLTGTLKALHPFMPFITEELYQPLKRYIGEDVEFLLSSRLPRPSGWEDASAVSDMGFIMEAVSALNALRSQLNIHPGKAVPALVSVSEPGRRRLLADYWAYIAVMAKLDVPKPKETAARPPHSATAVAGGVTFYVPLQGIIDFGKEKARLSREVSRLEAELTRCQSQLSNEQFVSRAPQDEVAKIRRRTQEAGDQHRSLVDTLRSLDGLDR